MAIFVISIQFLSRQSVTIEAILISIYNFQTTYPIKYYARHIILARIASILKLHRFSDWLDRIMQISSCFIHEHEFDWFPVLSQGCQWSAFAAILAEIFHENLN